MIYDEYIWINHNFSRNYIMITMGYQKSKCVIVKIK